MNVSQVMSSDRHGNIKNFNSFHLQTPEQDFLH